MTDDNWLNMVRSAVAGRRREPLSFLHPSDHKSAVLPEDGSHMQGQHAHDGVIKYPRDHRDTVAANRRMDSRPAGKGI